MITGSVNAYREPIVGLTVLGADGQELAVDAVIESGFDGSLSLPTAFIAALGLEWRRRGRAVLADGSETIFDIHEATIMWDGGSRRVAVDAAETEPLIGMSLLDGYELVIQVVNGGNVTIMKLP